MRNRSSALFMFCLVLVWLSGCRKSSEVSGGTAVSEQGPPRQVMATRAQVRPMIRIIAVTGTLAAQEKSVLSAKVTGRVQELLVDLGSEVRAGDLLAQIEPRDYELGLQQAAAALAQARTTLGLPPTGDDDQIELEAISAVRQAKAVLEEATSNRDRVRNLSQAGIASQSELETVEASYKVALSRLDTATEEARARLATVAQRRAAYELARKQLEDASVRAPFDGAVQARMANVGEYVGPGTPILEVVKTNPLRLRMALPERESALVRSGQVVHLSVEGDTNVYTGRIARLSPALDDQNRLLVVEADVEARGSLRAGLFTRANIIVDNKQEGLSVPQDAVVTFAGIEKVVLAQEGKAVERVVTTGRRGPGWVEILSGLQAGDPVILNPGGLRTGQRVEAKFADPVVTAHESASK